MVKRSDLAYQPAELERLNRKAKVDLRPINSIELYYEGNEGGILISTRDMWGLSYPQSFLDSLGRFPLDNSTGLSSSDDYYLFNNEDGLMFTIMFYRKHGVEIMIRSFEDISKDIWFEPVYTGMNEDEALELAIFLGIGAKIDYYKNIIS